jgi:hypothetical protein
VQNAVTRLRETAAESVANQPPWSGPASRPAVERPPIVTHDRPEGPRVPRCVRSHA